MKHLAITPDTIFSVALCSPYAPAARIKPRRWLHCLKQKPSPALLHNMDCLAVTSALLASVAFSCWGGGGGALLLLLDIHKRDRQTMLAIGLAYTRCCRASCSSYTDNQGVELSCRRQQCAASGASRLLPCFPLLHGQTMLSGMTWQNHRWHNLKHLGMVLGLLHPVRYHNRAISAVAQCVSCS